MSAYRTGDKPADPLVIVPTREGEPIDLAAFSAASVKVDTVTLSAVIDDDAVVASWPSTSVFTEPGIYPVTVTLTGTGVRETFEAAGIVAEEFEGWHTLASARRDWTTDFGDERLFSILTGARTACVNHLEFEPQTVTLSYREAQLMQARNAVNAGAIQAGGGGFGNDEYSYAASTFPMDWKVKALLRPPRIPKVR